MQDCKIMNCIFTEKELNTKCVVEMVKNQTVLHPAMANLGKGDSRYVHFVLLGGYTWQWTTPMLLWKCYCVMVSFVGNAALSSPCRSWQEMHKACERNMQKLACVVFVVVHFKHLLGFCFSTQTHRGVTKKPD